MENELARGEAVSAVKLVDLLMAEGRDLRASDVHIDPRPGDMRVRYRIDGRLKDYHCLPKSKKDEIITRIKIMAGLRTDEHQLPQDGRFRVNLAGEPLDVRVSVAPTYCGENAVLRLLANRDGDGDLASLGFSPANAAKIEKAARKPYGMILATGPTGSGKTTTLYALIKKLNGQEISIVTIEDPVEYAIAGVRQIQTNVRAGLTFAGGLRGILRQDPDVVMVGEIRDPETAGIAVNAALTGHLLFSSLHTNDAASALPRLLDMNIESYLAASTVNAIIAQRLARKICENCKTARQIGVAEFNNLKTIFPELPLAPGDVFYFGAGCSRCAGCGYAGRTGVHEVLVPDVQIREAILEKRPAEFLKRIAVSRGMSPMIEDGFTKAKNGITTIEEILRLSYE